jgi:hypothetical protein
MNINIIYSLFVRRKSRKLEHLENVPPGGIGGPNVGTSFARDTATLNKCTNVQLDKLPIVDIFGAR